MMSQATTYFVIILFSFMFVLVDTGVSYMNIYINKWYLNVVDKAKKQQIRKDLQSKSVIKRKVTTYDNRGFAFSQEAGNDRLLMETVSGRIGQALLSNIQKTAFITFGSVTKSDDKNFKVQ